MNILLVSDVSIYDVIGGAERVLYEQSIRLAGKSHNTHVLTRRLSSHQTSQETIRGVIEWRYNVNQKTPWSFIMSTRYNCKNLFDHLQAQYAFDCINFHQPFSALGVINSQASRGIKKIYTCHSLSFEEYQSRNKKPDGMFRKAIYMLNVQGRKIIERKVVNSSDRIIALSRFTQEKLWNAHRIPPDKVVIIPGGVDIEKFRPAINRVEIRKRLGIPEKSMTLITVRNMEPRMGLGNLVHAIKDVVKELPDTLLIIGGDGPLKNDLIKSVKDLNLDDHIKFTGFIPEQDLPDYYRASDIFILPTLELEGFGLITLEALASGTPVLGTPVGGTSEILGKFNSGYLFKDTTPESMSALIIKTCRQFKDNPVWWQNISSQCRAFVEENYSWKKNVELTEKILMDPNKKEY